MQRKHLLIVLLFSITLIIGAIMLLSDANASARHMGKIETLHNPVTLTGWNASGLTTTDGRTLPIPGIQNLPANSPALTEATTRGIEIAPDGRLTCLVRVYRWCGNDPITAEILRVDLADMLTYLQIGQPTAPVPHPKFLAHESGGTFHEESGWNVSDYFGFQMWLSAKGFPQDP